MAHDRAVCAWVAAVALASWAARAEAVEPSRLATVQSVCAAAADEAQRPGALERVLTVEAGGDGVHLDSDGRLVIDFTTPLSAEEGHVRLDGGDAHASATVRPEVAATLLQARADGKLIARVAFRLVEQEGMERPCTALGGGDFMRVRATPLWVDLIAGGRALARALTEEGAFEPSAGAIARAEIAPTVEGASGHEADLIAAVTRELREPALTCYRPAAKERRNGAIALALDVAATGSVSEVKVLIDGVRDASLSRCVVRAARELRFPKSSHGAHVTASLSLDLTPAR